MHKNDSKTTDKKVNKDEEIKDRTFLVKLKYTQNQSMQGSIQWIERGRAVNFRSMMELFSLLSDSVVNKEIRGWEDESGILTIIKK